MNESGKKVCVPLCGGNIDTTVLGRIIERGLAADQRLIRFRFIIAQVSVCCRHVLSYYNIIVYIIVYTIE
jgi:hypothetical protein